MTRSRESGPRRARTRRSCWFCWASPAAWCGGPRSVGLDRLAIIGKPGSEWWRLLTAPFIYNNIGYAFIALGAIALFGCLIERRHGPAPVVALFLVGGVGGIAATAAAYPVPIALGGNGAALALICAWAVPDLLASAPARRSRATCSGRS